MEASIVLVFEIWVWTSLRAFSSSLILFDRRLDNVLQDKNTIPGGGETYRWHLVAFFSAFFLALRMALELFVDWIILT
jgi:hypothetical protein